MEKTWLPLLEKIVEKNTQKIIDLRRHLHMYPELSGKERQTSLHLASLLDKHGFDVRFGKDSLGVIADYSHGEKKGYIALRGDIDALNIQEQNNLEYKSRYSNIMHACGHDTHAAIVYGALISLCELMKTNTLPFSLSIRGLFQPSEERGDGARGMIESACLENVLAVYALHVDPSYQIGSIGLRKGIFTSICDDLDIRIFGRGGHAARPHESLDPIAAAAQLISSVYLFIPRSISNQECVIVSFGKIEGGKSNNVIPDEVEIGGTLRTLVGKVRDAAILHLKRSR